MFSTNDISARVEAIIRSTLKLGSDVALLPESDLVSEVGLDSIEAFESVATLHELLGVRIPEDIDPKSVGTIKGITTYILERYSPEVVERFMTLDVEAKLALMHDDDELV